MTRAAAVLMLLAGAASAADPLAMGTAPCSWSVPIQRPDHTLDVDAAIRLPRANGFTCYVQPIEEAPPMAYDDFNRLLSAAQKAGTSSFYTVNSIHFFLTRGSGSNRVDPKGGL